MKSLRFLLIFGSLIASPVAAYADVYVHGYVRHDGTYVQPHMRSDPDGNPYNNWSTYPNVNPYTGQIGTHHVDPYSSSQPSPYRSPYSSSYGSGNNDPND